MKIRVLLLLIALTCISGQLFSGSFSMGIYGNAEGSMRENSATEVVSNTDWRVDYTKAYFELKLSGLSIEGFQFWSKLGGSAEFTKGGSFLDNPLMQLGNIGGVTGPVNNSLKGSDDNNYRFFQYEAHVQKSIDLFKKGKLTFIAFRSQNRTGLDQPYISFFGDIGDGNTKTGLRWDAYGIFGFYTKGFIVDYRSDEKDLEVSDRYAYAAGFRLGRELFKKDFLNINFGTTLGVSQYYKKYTISDSYSVSNQDIWNKYFYNSFGADLSMNGDLPLIGSYYFFFGWGRSYAPESYPYENYPLIALVGNSNANVFNAEFKWNRKFEFGDLDLGSLFFSFFLNIKQPNFQSYLGGGIDDKYRERFDLSYHFPVKALSLNASMEYYHNFDYDTNQYHIWQISNITDNAAGLKKHLDFNVLFKNGFSFNVAWDNETGRNYLGSFDSLGVNYLTFSIAGEGNLGRISPQLKIVALGDTNKQLLSSGIEIFLNISSWIKFYSRFAYVQSAGYWKSGENLNWWNAFVQFQFYPGNNQKLIFEMGNGGATGDGFVSDTDLINGASFEKKLYLKYEYWL